MDPDGSIASALRQDDYRVRFDWGLTAAEAAACTSDLIVVVDVLSFTTTVSLAVEAGVIVLPYPSGGGDVVGHARRKDAIPARGRRDGLSPASVSGRGPGERVVIPSPNGSAIAYRLASSRRSVLAGCLRNRAAVSAAVADRVADDRAVTVIAAGERWPDGSLRPCAEDLWGAGAILGLLPAALLSPEAQLAVHAFTAVATTLDQSLADCAGGRELLTRGCGGDVALAAQIDVDQAVPQLVAGAFLDARPTS